MGGLGAPRPDPAKRRGAWIGHQIPPVVAVVVVAYANGYGDAECEKTSKCVPTKHHYSECVERVTAAEESDSKGPKEDCVEECMNSPRRIVRTLYMC